jgi:hypothetical protein
MMLSKTGPTRITTTLARIFTSQFSNVMGL